MRDNLVTNSASLGPHDRRKSQPSVIHGMGSRDLIETKSYGATEISPAQFQMDPLRWRCLYLLIAIADDVSVYL